MAFFFVYGNGSLSRALVAFLLQSPAGATGVSYGGILHTAD